MLLIRSRDTQQPFFFVFFCSRTANDLNRLNQYDGGGGRTISTVIAEIGKAQGTKKAIAAAAAAVT